MKEVEKTPDTLIIIPAYNEGKTVGKIIEDVKKSLPKADVFVVDDGSSDSTAKVAKESGALVASLPFNMGYSVALQTGYKYAKSKKYRFILQMDADGQHEPGCLKDIVRELASGQADVVIGSRYLRKESYRPPFLRRTGMRFFAYLCSAIIRQRITDPTSGLQGFRREVLPFLVSDFFPIDYPDADVIVMIHRYGFKIKEVPVTMRPCLNNKSMHRGIRPIYYVFKMILSMFVILLRKKGE